MADNREANREDGAAGGVQYHRILAPLDGSQRAESALSLASILAESHSAQLLVVHVVVRPEMIQRVPLSLEDIALGERMVARNKIEAEKYFAQLHARLPANTEIRVLSDDSVARSLHELVEQERIDLVVLSAHGHSCHSQWPYSPLVNSFITYGATSLLILQDLPPSETRLAIGVHQIADTTMPARRENGEKGLHARAHFEI